MCDSELANKGVPSSLLKFVSTEKQLVVRNEEIETFGVHKGLLSNAFSQTISRFLYLIT